MSISYVVNQFIVTFRVLCALVLVGLAAGCDRTDVASQTQSSPMPIATPVPIVLAEGKSAIKGFILPQGNRAFPADMKVYLVPIFWNPAHTEAVYAVDEGQAITTPIYSNGYFQLVNIVPGEYVLVAGATLEGAGAILNERNQARVFMVKANEALDIGEQRINLPTTR